jgi:hypothetical protein
MTLEKKCRGHCGKPICDEAIRVVNIVNDHNILNEDVRSKEGSKNGYKVFMIDFALSRLRESDEADDGRMQSSEMVTGRRRHRVRDAKSLKGRI